MSARCCVSHRRRPGVPAEPLTAILLADSYGTGVRALFPDTPKALIPVGGHALEPLTRFVEHSAQGDAGEDHREAASRRSAFLRAEFCAIRAKTD